MNKKDILGKPLEVGDYVFVTRKNYRDIVISRIISFTPKQVRVVYNANWTGSLYPEVYLTGEVIKIEEIDVNSIPQNTKTNLDTLFLKEMEKNG